MAAKDFADFAFEPTWLHVVTHCAAVCARLGAVEHAGTLLTLLRPYDGQFVTMSSLAYTGPVAHYLGVLAATLGRRDEALGHYASAASASERMGAPTWLARTRLEWARCLLDAGETEAAAPLLDRALDTAVQLGLATVERGVQEVRATSAGVQAPLA